MIGSILPDNLTVNISELDFDPEHDDMDELGDIISDWLSDSYGYCHLGFDYDVDAVTGDIVIEHILWDTSEEEDIL